MSRNKTSFTELLGYIRHLKDDYGMTREQALAELFPKVGSQLWETADILLALNLVYGG